MSDVRTGILKTGFLVMLVASPAYGQQTYSGATNEALGVLSENTQDITAEMIEQQANALMEQQNLKIQEMQGQTGDQAAGTSQPQTTKKYVYKPHKGNPALKGVELPERLFHNIPDVRP